MTYDLEKYREKREKVLGVKKRGVSFGTLAAVVSVIIVIGMGAVVIPKSIAYFSTRHLDDAIYKMNQDKDWSEEILQGILSLEGVENAIRDSHGRRLVVTFDRTVLDPVKIYAFFEKKGFKVTLLNRVSHRQRMATLKKEARFEAL